MTFTVLVLYALMTYWVVRRIRNGRRKLTRAASSSLSRSARRRIREQMKGIKQGLAKRGRKALDPDGSHTASWKRFQLDPGQTPESEEAAEISEGSQEESVAGGPPAPDHGDAPGLELDGAAPLASVPLDIEPDTPWPAPSGSLGDADPMGSKEPELLGIDHGLPTRDHDPEAGIATVQAEAPQVSELHATEQGPEAPGDEPFSGESAASALDEPGDGSPPLPGPPVERAEIQAALFAEHRPGFEIEDEFEERFRGRSLRWTGTLDQANSILGTDRVELRLLGHAGDGMERPITVSCELSTSEAGDLLGQRGIEITVEGTLESCDPYMQGLRLKSSRRS